MKTLLLMRHAKSSWSDTELSDHDRPLNKRGRRAAPWVGEFLRQQNWLPDFVVTSTAVRASETAQAVARACSYEGPMEITRRLYLSEPSAYLETLSAVPQGKQRVLLVGHNPTVSELLLQLTGEEREMTTAALAVIELDTPEFCDVKDSTRGKLVHLVRPPKEEKK